MIKLQINEKYFIILGKGLWPDKFPPGTLSGFGAWYVGRMEYWKDGIMGAGIRNLGFGI